MISHPPRSDVSNQSTPIAAKLLDKLGDKLLEAIGGMMLEQQ